MPRCVPIASSPWISLPRPSIFWRLPPRWASPPAGSSEQRTSRQLSKLQSRPASRICSRSRSALLEEPRAFHLERERKRIEDTQERDNQTVVFQKWRSTEISGSNAGDARAGTRHNDTTASHPAFTLNPLIELAIPRPVWHLLFVFHHRTSLAAATHTFV